MPDFPAGSGIERPAFIAAGHIHDALNHNRRRFRARDAFHRKYPLRRQPRNITFINLLELTVAVPANVPIVGGPVHLGGHLAETIPFGPQQMNFPIGRSHLKVRDGFVHHQTGEVRTARDFNGPLDRSRTAKRPNSSQKRNETGFFVATQGWKGRHAEAGPSIQEQLR